MPSSSRSTTTPPLHARYMRARVALLAIADRRRGVVRCQKIASSRRVS